MPTEIKYYRKNHIITDTKGIVVFIGKAQRKVNGPMEPSNNAAKAHSRLLQVEEGQGCVRVKS